MPFRLSAVQVRSLGNTITIQVHSFVGCVFGGLIYWPVEFVYQSKYPCVLWKMAWYSQGCLLPCGDHALFFPSRERAVAGRRWECAWESRGRKVRAIFPGKEVQKLTWLPYPAMYVASLQVSHSWIWGKLPGCLLRPLREGSGMGFWWIWVCLSGVATAFKLAILVSFSL